jgi:DNA recombination protein RmuC
MDFLLYAFLALIALLLIGLIVLLLRRGDNGETQAVRQHLEMALSQQAETVQRVERSLREQEQALSKVVSERLDRSE